MEKMLAAFVLLTSLASAQAYWCGVCDLPGFTPENSYCCYNFIDNDSHYCCTWQDYYLKGGMFSKNAVIITAAVSVAVCVLLILCCCCFYCSCCPCYKRRRQGTVYNTVPEMNGTTPNAPMYQHQPTKMFPVQYPAQPPNYPYLSPEPSAPVCVPPAYQ